MQLSYGSVKNINDGLYIKNNPQDASDNLKVDNNQKEKDNNTNNNTEE